MLKKVLLVLLAIAMLSFAWAQTGTIKGVVKNSKDSEPIMGANILVEGTSLGAASSARGTFIIEDVPVGKYTVIAQFIGFTTAQKTVIVEEGETVEITFNLKSEKLDMRALEVMASRATQETPVAYTNVEKPEMEFRLASRDIPMVLNTTPSVYATPQGGGAGDARINLRGFDQRNIAIMLNGVPVNDMENGWVYWSNWDGVGDATSSIQVQRGLSAVNLATPSIGGTMNIITDPAQMDRGYGVKQEIGSWGFQKTTAYFNSGLINDRFAFNGSIVCKTGDGYNESLWTDAWAYYFGASASINESNRFELYVVGAPQRHGQRLYAQNIGTFSHDFAKDLDSYDHDALDDYKERGYHFNQNYAEVDESYRATQAVGERRFNRYKDDILNSRENFYHKPQVNLNHYLNINEQLRLSSILYYSGGEGGGTGTYGEVFHRDGNNRLEVNAPFYYGPGPWTYDWDATIEMNRAGAGKYLYAGDSLAKEDGQSLGILRNSRNNQWTIGLISKAYYTLSDELEITVGIDWRTAEIEHYREVRDLLGGDYFVKTADQFNPDQKVGLGEKVAYNFTNTVDWFGGFAQADYQVGPFTAYGMGGYSMIKYTHNNHFKKDDNGNQVELESDWIAGYQVKGGASYRVVSNIDVYGNFGYVEKVPIFDNVISDYLAAKAENPENETFVSLEGGLNFLGLMNNTLNSKISIYHTTWQDRAQSRGITQQDGSEGIIFLSGMDQLHQGIELEANYQPLSLVKLDVAASVGNWKMMDDVKGSYKDWEGGSGEKVEYNFYVEDLKVGNAPQTQLSIAGTLNPLKGMSAQLIYKYYDNHHADWNPFDRTDQDDDVQSWQAPSYGLMDFHTSYDLPIDVDGMNIKVFAHVLNVLDKRYIQDATDNSDYNAFDDDHDADDAEVFFGLPRRINAGFEINF